METKLKGFVSNMKDKIIKASIESIKKEGLRFSVDSLANSLKISKKTIYKYFPDKESLAIALYEKIFCDAFEKANALKKQSEATAQKELLHLYFDCKWMTRREIFNKYKLNKTIYAYVADKINSLWELIAASFDNEESENTKETLRIIIDGSFEKLCNTGLMPDAVIERLVNLL